MNSSPRHNRKRDAAGAGPGPRVLIVDDEAAILFAYGRLIEREGIAVDGCASFEAAASLLQCCDYDVVIADLRLSGTDNRDGLELLRLAQERGGGTRVILVTGYGTPEIERADVSLGVAHYFEKPVAPETILAALKGLLQPGRNRQSR